MKGPYTFEHTSVVTTVIVLEFLTSDRHLVYPKQLVVNGTSLLILTSILHIYIPLKSTNHQSLVGNLYFVS